MADENHNANPEIKAQRPQRPPRRLEERHARMWGAYVAGSRTLRALMRDAKVQFGEAKKAVEEGWPEYGWPPFRDAGAAADAQVAAAVALGAKDAAAVLSPSMQATVTQHITRVITSWEDFQTRQLAIFAKLQAGLEPQAEAIAAAGERLKGDGTAYDRIVVTEDGAERVIDGGALATASQKVTAAAKEVTTAASLLLGKPTERTETTYPEPTADELALLDAGHWPEAWPLARRDAYVARLEKSTPTVH